jgi:hypothetical protein
VIINGGTFGVHLQDIGSEVLTQVDMKSSISWDIKLCSPLKVNTRFVGTYFHAGFLLGLFFDPEDRRDMFLRNSQLIFNSVHGVASQKIEFFIFRLAGSGNSFVTFLPSTKQYCAKIHKSRTLISTAF